MPLTGTRWSAMYLDWAQRCRGQGTLGILNVLRELLAEQPRAQHVAHFPGSAAYWDQRYARGGNSGAGSAGQLAAFKAAVVNRLVVEHHIESVLELGCGDGRQLALAAYPTYVGMDVSPVSVALCRERFAPDASKRFLLEGTEDPGMADLVLSLDVIFHLVEDNIFDAYMAALFVRARRMVVIYSSDRDETTLDAHVRHRAVSVWVKNHAPEWERIAHVANPYPFDPARPSNTSFADFHIYGRAQTAQQPGPPAKITVAPAASPDTRIISRGDRDFRVVD